MLSKEITEKLNRQIVLEDYSAHTYLAMYSWAQSQGYTGAAIFLMNHYHEEVKHMLKLLHYVNEAGGHTLIESNLQQFGSISNSYRSLQELFQIVLKNEQTVTQAINSLVDFCLQQKDYSTFQFLQWYVAEQHEEETLFKGILDKINLIGVEGRGIYLIDKEIGKLGRATN